MENGGGEVEKRWREKEERKKEKNFEKKKKIAPPWSSGHSPSVDRSDDPKPDRAQKSERSMIGTSPMKTLG